MKNIELIHKVDANSTDLDLKSKANLTTSSKLRILQNEAGNRTESEIRHYHTAVSQNIHDGIKELSKKVSNSSTDMQTKSLIESSINSLQHQLVSNKVELKMGKLTTSKDTILCIGTNKNNVRVCYFANNNKQDEMQKPLHWVGCFVIEAR